MRRAKDRAFLMWAAMVVRPFLLAAAILTWVFTLPLLLDDRLAATVGHDFAHFYTIGRVALEHKPHVLYDPAALAVVQTSLVPTVGGPPYPPLYPPQTAVFFAPMSLLSFSAASALWAIISAGVYFAVVFTTWRRFKRQLADGVFVWAAALAFPPFWYLILFRQNSAIVLCALWAGWLAWEARRPVIAGVAFGCLALKPQFGMVLMPLLVIRREWPVVRGVAMSLAVQAVAALAFLGPAVFIEYLRYVPRLLRGANSVEPVLYKSVSLRALFRLLPEAIAMPLWLIGALIVFVAVHRAWRAEVPLRIRLVIVVLGTVLVNPHMYVYDGVVLAPALLWLGTWHIERGTASQFRVQALLLAFALWLLMPASLALGAAAGLVAMAGAVGLEVWMLAAVLRAAARLTSLEN